MINQQLLDFIKSQLLKGIDSETITKELQGSGWAQTDINEGFSAINAPMANPVINPIINPVAFNSINNPILTQTVNHSGKKVLLIIVTLFVIAGGVSGYYFRNDIPVIKDLIKSKSVPVNEIQQEGNTQAQIQKESNIVQPQQEQNQGVVVTEPTQESVKTGPINCGTEMKCFMSAVKTCAPAFVEQTTTLNIFGIYSQTNKTKMTLTGYDSAKKCGYLSKVISANVDYSPEIKATPEYKAGTNEQKNADLAEPNASAKNTIGMVTKCSFTTTYLSAILAVWSKGEYSSEDYKPGNCSAIDSNGKALPLYTGGSNDPKGGFISSGENNITTISSNNKPSNEIDLYLNKQTIFSDKSISSSDLGFTLLEAKDDPSDEGGHDKIYKISVIKIGTSESKTITVYDNDFYTKNQSSIFGVAIRSVGYSYISAMMNNGVEQTKLSIQILKQ